MTSYTILPKPITIIQRDITLGSVLVLLSGRYLVEYNR